MNHPSSPMEIYEQLNQQYQKSGFTYKSNEILHKTSQTHPRLCPYQLLLAVAKIYHMNQFQTIFFTHILNQPSARKAYQHDHDRIFQLQNVKFPESVDKMISQVYDETNQYSRRGVVEQIMNEQNSYNEENMEQNNSELSLDDFKRIYLYLMVIGYAIKYYLNQPVKAKPYEQYANGHIQNFIPGIFNKWARNHGNTALSTTPRKINAYYMNLGFLQGQEQGNTQEKGQDCQYRNYNEIVEELIRATMQEGDDQGQLVVDEGEHE